MQLLRGRPHERTNAIDQACTLQARPRTSMGMLNGSARIKARCAAVSGMAFRCPGVTNAQASTVDDVISWGHERSIARVLKNLNVNIIGEVAPV